MSFRSKKTREALLAKDAATSTDSPYIIGSTPSGHSLNGLQPGSTEMHQTGNQKTPVVAVLQSKQQQQPNQHSLNGLQHGSSKMQQTGNQKIPVTGVLQAKQQQQPKQQKVTMRHDVPTICSRTAPSGQPTTGSTPIRMQHHSTGTKQHHDHLVMKQAGNHPKSNLPQGGMLSQDKQQQSVVRRHVTTGSMLNTASSKLTIGSIPTVVKVGHNKIKLPMNRLKLPLGKESPPQQREPQRKHDHHTLGSTPTILKDSPSGMKQTDFIQSRVPQSQLQHSKERLPSSGISFGPFTPSDKVAQQQQINKKPCSLASNSSKTASVGSQAQGEAPSFAKSSLTFPESPQLGPHLHLNTGKRPMSAGLSCLRRDSDHPSTTSTPSIALSKPIITESAPNSPTEEPLMNFESQSQNSDEENEETGSRAKKLKSTVGGRRKSRVLDWPDDIEDNIQEKVLTIDAQGNQKWVRGSIQPRDVSKQNEVRYFVSFNEFKQPIKRGGSILVRYLGYLAKLERFCPLCETTWHRVNKTLKAELIVLVRSKFVIPTGEIYDKAALKRVDKHWRQYKYSLKKTKFLPKWKANKPKEAIYDDVPDGHPRNSWMTLVDYWCSPRGQELSNMGKSARGFQDHLHTCGGTSFANRRADFVATNKREPSNLEFFDLTHKTKDGDFLDSTSSKEFFEQATAKVNERMENSSSSKSLVDVQNEVFDELMYEDGDPKRPVGYGFGVNKGDVFGVHGELRKRGYSNAHDNSMTNFLLTKQNQLLHQQKTALESTVQQNNQLIRQILNAFATGQVSQEFLDTVRQSVQQTSNSQVPNVLSGDGTTKSGAATDVPSFSNSST